MSRREFQFNFRRTALLAPFVKAQVSNRQEPTSSWFEWPFSPSRILACLTCLLWISISDALAQGGVPFVYSQPVTEISYAQAGTARFNGSVQPNGFDTEAWFEISTNPDFNPNVFFYRRYPSTNLSRLASSYPITYRASNFVPFGTFFSRLAASNSAGISFGSNQVFTTRFSEAVPTHHVISGLASWTDYNSDGRFDFLLSGWTGTSGVSRLYQNLGIVNVNGFTTNLFTNSLPNLVSLTDSLAAWGDFNNDGMLDLVLSGYTGTNRLTRIYRNNGSNGFSSLNVELPGVWPGSVHWADFDSDGKADILLAGQTDSGGTAKIYRNNGNDSFTDVNAPFADLLSAIVSVNDFDNDGDIDVLVTGSTGEGVPTLRLYRNESAWNFRETASALPPMVGQVVMWMDYDSDGDDDLLLSGTVYSTQVRKLYRNNGDLTFTDSGISFGEESSYSVQSGHSGDLDGDGDIDLTLLGIGHNAFYRNEGQSGFIPVDSVLDDIGRYRGDIADYDNDGDLDFLFSGVTYFPPNSPRIFKYEGSSNSPPSVPTGLTFSLSNTTAFLKWQASTDLQTPDARGLTYNLRVGRTSTGIDVLAPNAHPLTGQRRLSGPGNAGHGTNAVLEDLNSLTTYYWSVQAIDNGYAASSFALRSSFTTSLLPPRATTFPPKDFAPPRLTLVGHVNPKRSSTAAWFEWGTSTNYGNETAYTTLGAGTNSVVISADISGLQPEVTYHYRLVAQNSAGRVQTADSTFSAARFTKLDFGFPPLNRGALSLVDYDGDNDLDAVIAGETNHWSNSSLFRLYRNDGNGAFADAGMGVTNTTSSCLAWSDFDNDGDLDLFFTGWTSGNPVSAILRNDGTNGFRNAEIRLPSMRIDFGAWGDLDNDGDWDLVVSGLLSNIYVTRLCRNNGNGRFEELDTGLPGVSQPSIVSGDYDGDGDTDLLMTGQWFGGASYETVWWVLRNDGGLRFTPVVSAINGAFSSVTTWGDFDSDGDLDILVAGSNGTFVFRNDGADLFVNINAALPLAPNGEVHWIDYDNDGDLDVFLTGIATSIGTGANSALYRNNGDETFTDVLEDFSRFVSTPSAWGDVNNDGDLDLFIGGAAPFSPNVSERSAIYRNNSAILNHPPTEPTELNANVQGVGVVLSWGGSTDPETTNSAGLTYNIRVGTTPGGSEVMSAHSDNNSGYHRLPQFGNVQHGTTAFLTNLAANTTYYWSVQAIDSAFAGSVFAEEQTFTSGSSLPGVTTLPASEVVTPTATLGGAVNPFGLDSVAWFEWGVDTNYGHQTIVTNVGLGTSPISIHLGLTGLVAETTYHFRLVATNEAGRAEGSDQSFWTPLFTEFGEHFRGASHGAVAWVDYDNDGDLDFTITGTTNDNTSGTSSGSISLMYSNVGGHAFSIQGPALPGVAVSIVDWVDWDSDGDEDLLFGGGGRTGFFIYGYENFGNGNLTNRMLFSGDYMSKAVFVDRDNDGDVDLLVDGRLAGGFGANVVFQYDNDGLGSFTKSITNAIGWLPRGPVSADIDSDGDWDIAGAPRPIVNNAGLLFLTNSQLPVLQFGAAAWADYDQDGDADVLVTGTPDGNAINAITKLFRNDGDLQFSEVFLALPPVVSSSVAWGDFDNDGDLDFVLTGIHYDGTNYPSITQLYRNEGNEHFADIGAELPGVGSSSVAWADYDNDGDLDLLLTGWTGVERITRIYRNNTSKSNTPPTAPTGLAAAVTGRGVRLMWNAAQDSETTNSAGLTYNLRVGTQPGTGDIMSPSSDSTTGFRRIPKMGNVQHGTSAWLTNLPPGTRIYWSVQAVDTSFAGSRFADEESFDVTPIAPLATTLPPQEVTAPATILSGRIVPGGTSTMWWFEWGEPGHLTNRTPTSFVSGGLNPQPVIMTVTGLMAGVTYATRLVATNSSGLSTGTTVEFSPPAFVSLELNLPGCFRSSARWGDFDGDGDLDIALSGLFGSTPALRVYRNFGSTNFSLSQNLPGGPDGALVWADLNGDGEIDLFSVGVTNTLNNVGVARFHGNAGGQFTSSDIGLPPAIRGNIDSADFDSDGILDIIISGSSGGQRLTRLFRRNSRTSGFLTLPTSLPGIEYGTINWVDFDNDGHADIFLSGTTNGAASGAITRIYANIGNGIYTNQVTSLSNTWHGTAAFADFDNDGNIDIALAGLVGGSRTITLYRNTGSFAFVPVPASLRGVEDGSLSWGDFDNDGFQDLAIMGSTNGTRLGTICGLYKGDGAGGFFPLALGLQGAWRGAITAGDYDNDGDLDLLISGESTTNSITRVIRNDRASRNRRPSPPELLSARVIGSALELNWGLSSDLETPSAALSYNVRIGRKPATNDIQASHSIDESGIRLLPQSGNAGRRLTATVTNLPLDSLFNWSVQSVDGALAGSEFAPEATAYIGRPRILSISRNGGEQFHLRAGGTPGVSYYLQTTEDFVSWSDRLRVEIDSNGISTDLIDASGMPFDHRYYRLRQE